MSSDEKLSFGEARRRVIDIQQLCRTGGGALELSFGEDLDSLKTVQYALLTAPVTKGLGDYLDNFKPEPKPRFLLASELAELIGHQIGDAVIETLEKDPHKELIEEIAKKRAENLYYPQMIFPVDETIMSAAVFSSNQMYCAAASNAAVVWQATKDRPLPRADFLDAVRKSHQLPLAIPTLHLEWNTDFSDELVAHGDGVLSGQPSLNNENLVYDHKDNRVKLNTPVTDWIASTRTQMMAKRAGIDLERFPFKADILRDYKIGDASTKDARVGCPVSFDPALVKRYYEHVVDMIEAHQSWPGPFANERAQAQKVLESYGIVPGFRI